MTNLVLPASGDWAIYSVQKTLPVLGQLGGVLGTHDYLVLVDPTGHIQAELQGVYTNHFTVNGPDAGNYLQVQMWNPNTYMRDQSVTGTKLVVSGTQTAMQNLLQQGYNAVAAALNQTHELYDGAEIIGHAVNSNSVWFTALKAMGIADPSAYDGPDSTPGNSIDLRTEPTNNEWIGAPQDTWTPNPTFTLDPSKMYGGTGVQTGSMNPDNGYEVVDNRDNVSNSLLASTAYTYDPSQHLASTTENYTNTLHLSAPVSTVQNLAYNDATATTTATLVYGARPLGTLTLNTSNDGNVTLADGTVIPINVNGSVNLTVPPAGDTPKQALLDYLNNNLATPMTADQLDQLHLAHLYPAAQSTYVVSPSSISGGGVNVTNAPDTQSAFVVYSVANSSSPGAIVTGLYSVPVTDYTVGTDSYGQTFSNPYPNVETAINILDAGGDLSHDTISNIQVLAATGDVTLTADQFNSFHIVWGSGVITAATGGVFDLTVQGHVLVDYADYSAQSLVASAWSGTTLIGNEYTPFLVASLFGNDTLKEGNVTGGKLIAGDGVDTMIGGTGGDTFYVGTSVTVTESPDLFPPGVPVPTYTYAAGNPANGSVIQGQGTGNTLVASGDISGITISDIQTLQINGTITMTVAQLNGFGAITGSGSIALTTDGAYNLANVSGAISVTAPSSGGTTITASNTGGQTLTADGVANTTLVTGTGAGYHLNAANTAGNNTLDASHSSGGDTLDISNSSGNNTEIAGSGNGYVMNGTGAVGNNTFIAGPGDALIEGGLGNNTYVFAATSTGNTTVVNNNTGANQSIIEFGTGIAVSQVALSKSGNDLVLTIGVDPITVQNYFVGTGNKINALQFADGTTISSAQIDAMFVPLTPGQQESVNVFGQIVTSSTLASVANVLGSGPSFDGSGNTSKFASLNTTHQLTVSEFDNTGAITFATRLKNTDGSAYTAPTGTTLIETAQNLLGNNGYDVVTQINGGATIAEFNAAGLALATHAATYSSVASGGSVSVTGANQLVVGSSATITFGTNGAGDILQGTSDTVTLGNSSSLSVVGSNDTFTLGSGDTLNLNSGTGETINSVGNIINAATGTSLTLNGGGNTVNAANGVAMTVGGNSQFGWSDVVHESGGSITLASNSSLEIVGSNNVITGSDHAHVGIDSGNNNTITVGSNGNVYVEASTGTIINETGGVITLDTGVSASIVGGGDSISAATGDTVALSGNGKFGWADSITMTGGTVNVATNVSMQIAGANNVINGAGTDQIGIYSGDHNQVTAGSGSDVWVNSGNGTIITTSGSEIDLAANIHGATIIGSNNTIYASSGDNFDIQGSNITVNGSNLTLWLDANTTNVTLNGSNDIVHIRSGDTGTINGSNDPVTTDAVLAASNATTINHFNGTNQLIDLPGLAFDTSITVTKSVSGSSGTLTVQDHGVTVDTINLTNITSIGSFIVRPDGNGGTLLQDPPDSYDDVALNIISEPVAHQDGFRFADFNAAQFKQIADEIGGSVPQAALSAGDQFIFHAEQMTRPMADQSAEFIVDNHAHTLSSAQEHTSDGNGHGSEPLDSWHGLHAPNFLLLDQVHGPAGFHLV